MATTQTAVSCPICGRQVKASLINQHLDSGCQSGNDSTASSSQNERVQDRTSNFFSKTASQRVQPASSPTLSKDGTFTAVHQTGRLISPSQQNDVEISTSPATGSKRAAVEELSTPQHKELTISASKRTKLTSAPLAERMRPKSLDDVAGQELVGPGGVIRNLILTDRVPSMILWGGPGTGKTTIARLIAHTAGTRFVEINSTSSGVGECKKLFDEARNEAKLTGRKTIIFCDEIHRFSKSQQDVFLAPVEAGQIVLIGATTENPSFKVVNALLSRCRTFTLSKLTEANVLDIMKRAFHHEAPYVPSSEHLQEQDSEQDQSAMHILVDNDYALLSYLAAFADGDARTALNLLELAMDLCRKPDTTAESIKKSLTQTLVYDRAGDQHYDTISAFHKSVRGSDADAALYYLARMLQSGEDPLYIARRMVVIASEDVGLADNNMLALATAAYTAAEKIGMPECRINLAHCAVALSLSPKSVRAYRGLNAAYGALKEPGIAGLAIPIHLRNAPTRLMRELGYGKEYKYNPDYKDGEVAQDYLPDQLLGRRFLQDEHLGQKYDLDREVMRGDDANADTTEELLLGPDGD